MKKLGLFLCCTALKAEGSLVHTGIYVGAGISAIQSKTTCHGFPPKEGGGQILPHDQGGTGGVSTPFMNGLGSFTQQNAGAAPTALLGFRFCVPCTPVVLGMEGGLAMGGWIAKSKGMVYLNTVLGVPLGAITTEQQSNMKARISPQWTGIIGFKIGPFLPYFKVGRSYRKLQSQQYANTMATYGAWTHWAGTFDHEENRYNNRGRATFRIMGGGIDYHVTKNMILGGSFFYERGNMEMRDGSNPNTLRCKNKVKHIMISFKYLFSFMQKIDPCIRGAFFTSSDIGGTFEKVGGFVKAFHRNPSVA